MTSFRLISLMLILIPTLLFASGSVTSGVSLLVEGGDSDAGFGIEYTQLGDISKHFSLGGRFGFNRWTDEFSWGYDEFEIAINILEFAPAMRINAPLNEDVTYFFEPSAGFNLMVASVSLGSESESDSEGAFGVSLGTGFDIKRLEIKPAYKMCIKDGETAKWFALALGVAF